MITLPSLLAVARGEQPADLVIRNGRLVNVFSGALERADIAIVQDRIAGIGPGYTGATELDVQDAIITPGLIDAHVHIESSLSIPAHFASAVVPRGITTAVIDPHEIANVAGLAGIRFMAESSRRLPLRVVVMASSCVPATAMESTGATLSADDLAGLLQEGAAHGLAEVMNFPGVIHADPHVLAKLVAYRGRPIDGHAPLLHGHELNAYVAAGIGSEHECTTVEEAAEKLARGLYILIRQATNARNLRPLLPLITPANSRRICFCTDDRIPSDLLDEGSIDAMVRVAIAHGLDPVDVIRMATLNPAEWFGLYDRGALAPGRVADLVISHSLDDFRADAVYVGGKAVAAQGSLRPEVELPVHRADAVLGTVNVNWDAVSLHVAAHGRRIRVIGAAEDQLVTENRELDAKIVGGQAVADPDRDVLKIAVIERHHATGNMAVGFIQGFGLQRGALAGTVAHDHHNLITIGADDTSMLTAAKRVAELGGGLAVAEGDRVLAALPLPVAGLMSDRPIAEVRAGYDALRRAAAALGSPLHDPFMAMSFMGLEVIPALKLTDQGLIDVTRFAPVGLFV